MKHPFLRLLSFLFVFTYSLTAQNISFKELEKKVDTYNHQQKFDTSIKLISDFISENESSHFENYNAYLLKANIYKSLFNYPETFNNLSLALQEGLQTNKKEEVKAVISAEKAYAYFDIQEYKKAYELMSRLKDTKYQYIETRKTAYLIMQEGYIDYLNKKYDAAEANFDEAISIMNDVDPVSLPLVYGKKIELYKTIGKHEKSKIAFDLGYESAKKSKLVKYQIYMYEQLREQQMVDNDWKSAFKSTQIIKELETKYNADENNNKLKLLEKDIEIQRIDFELKKGTIIQSFLLVLLVVVVVLLILSYKLYKSNVKTKKIIEYEYDKINTELKNLTQQLDNKGFVNLNLSNLSLTSRQLEIIELIRKGKSNKEIGAILFISENTVKYHLKSIYQILNIENRAGFFKIISE